MRLLTVTGPGGVGKTRLALALAADLVADYQDGVCLVSLERLAEPALVTTTVAQTLGIRESAGLTPAAQLRLHLRDRGLLIVLDNFEHVLSATADLADLLAACPGITLLATSRAALGLRWEHQFPLKPLPVPALGDCAMPTRLGANPAVALFIARARAVSPAFALTVDNAATVAAICRCLDGLPLAIELAAAWISSLPPDALLARLGAPLQLLADGPRDLPARQRSLRDTLVWSHGLLAWRERRLFARLAFFQGGCSLAAIEAICADDNDEEAAIPRAMAIEVVATLVRQSLLQQLPTGDGSPRFTMLATVQAYARKLLMAGGEEKIMRERHAAYYLTLAEHGAAELFGPHQTLHLEQLTTEQDNLRAALAWFMACGDIERGLHLGAALGTFWRIRGDLREARERLREVLARAGSDRTPAVLRALNVAGNLAWRQGDDVAAADLAERCLALGRELQDERAVADTLNWRISMARERGDHAYVARPLPDMLAVARRLGDDHLVASATLNLGLLAADKGDLAGAQARLNASLALFDQLGDAWHVARTHYFLGLVARSKGQQAAARTALDRALSGLRVVGYRIGIADALTELGWLDLEDGQFDGARARFAEAVTFVPAVGRRAALLIEGVACLLLAWREPAGACRLLGAAMALRELTGTRPPLSKADILAHAQRGARAALGVTKAEAVETAGRALALDDALSETRRALASAPAPPRTGDKSAEDSTSLETPMGSTGTATAGLTVRELEVLRLVAEGLTDAEVAAHLSLARRTIGTHLANIYGKLGVATRTAAARVAHERGLL